MHLQTEYNNTSQVSNLTMYFGYGTLIDEIRRQKNNFKLLTTASDGFNWQIATTPREAEFKEIAFPNCCFYHLWNFIFNEIHFPLHHSLGNHRGLLLSCLVIEPMKLTALVSISSVNNTLFMGPIKKYKAAPIQCKWYIYGCKHQITTDIHHQEICTRRPRDPGGEPLWRELVTRLHMDARPTIDIMAALGPWARDIKPIAFLSAGQTPIQDFPYYLDVSSWWSDGMPKIDALQAALLPSLKRHLGAVQCRRLMEQLNPESTHLPTETLRILNHPSPRHMLRNLGFQVPKWVPLPMEQCLWNVTPKHAYTDLHTDRGLDTVTFQVGGRKLWLLYEPDPPVQTSNKVLQRQSKFFQQWARHFGAAFTPSEDPAMASKNLLEIVGPTLRRPYLAVTEEQQGLFVPAGWKHAVFTLESGYLAGYSFCTHEHLEQHVTTLLCELEASLAYQNTTQHGHNTDYLLPELWEELNQSLAYVLLHLTEILQSKMAALIPAAKQLWQQLKDFLESCLPAMKAKNGAAIKKCIRLAKAGSSP
jgi:hypothetical protein